MPETIETMTGLHTMQALTLTQLADLIRSAFSPYIASAMLGGSSEEKPPVNPIPSVNGDLRAHVSENEVLPSGNIERNGNTIRGHKLRTLADAMQKEIDSKRNPATAQQNLTRRRMGIIEGMRADAEKMEEIQHALYALADEQDSGKFLPGWMQRIATRKEVQDILSQYNPTGDAMYQQSKLKKMAADYKPVNAEEKAAEELKRGIREREKRAALQGIPGFFPTPAALSDRLVRLADIKPGMRVLEPSAGAGHLADEIKRQCPDVGAILCLEQNHTLVQILKDKGHEVLHGDFMQMSTAGEQQREVDRIVMNPPFEASQDIDHIRHAYAMLRPGGILAAILCEGPFCRLDRKAVEFRSWLEGTLDPFTDGPEIITNEKNPDGSFEKSDRPTGVATRTLVLRRLL